MKINLTSIWTILLIYIVFVAGAFVYFVSGGEDRRGGRDQGERDDRGPARRVRVAKRDHGPGARVGVGGRALAGGWRFGLVRRAAGCGFVKGPSPTWLPRTSGSGLRAPRCTRRPREESPSSCASSTPLRVLHGEPVEPSAERLRLHYQIKTRWL